LWGKTAPSRVPDNPHSDKGHIHLGWEVQGQAGGRDVKGKGSWGPKSKVHGWNWLRNLLTKKKKPEKPKRTCKPVSFLDQLIGRKPFFQKHENRGEDGGTETVIGGAGEKKDRSR